MNFEHREVQIEGLHYMTGKPIRIWIGDGLIHGMEALPPDTDKFLPWIGPGLIDLQINGCGGIDFNTLPLDKEQVLQLSRELWKGGVTSYYPTVITNGDLEIEHIVQSIALACEADERLNSCIQGIHLEGPFISPEDGPRGAHPKQHVKAPDWELFQRWQEASGKRIRLVTLSPEWPESIEFIRRCREHDVIVSIGHTAAAPEQIRDAVAAGATLSTHLGNGAHLMLPRHPNYLWEQLAQDRLWASVIADGFHLPDAFLKVVLRVKGERALLVSDAVSLCGMPAGSYDLHIGGKVVLTKEGKLHLSGNPHILAGSAQMLVHGINHLLQSRLCELSEAWEMASLRPASLMGMTLQRGLAIGAAADLVAFSLKDNDVQIKETYKGGQKLFPKKINTR